MFSRTIFLTISFTVLVGAASCNKSGGNGSNSGSREDGNNNSSTGGGEIKSLSFAGALALGLVEVNGSALTLDSGTKKAFVTVKEDGGTTKNDLPSLGFSSESELTSIERLNPDTLVAKGVFRSAGQENSTVPSVATVANILTVDRSGAIEMLPSDVPKDAVVGPGGKLWFIQDGLVKYWNPASKSTTTVTDEQLVVDHFLGTSDGALFISGSVKTTGAQFSRLIREGGSGFELVEFKPSNTFNGMAYAPLAMSSMRNGNLSFQSTAIFEMVSGQLQYFFAPWDIQNGLEKYTSTTAQNGGQYSALFRPTGRPGTTHKIAKVDFPLNEPNFGQDIANLQQFDRANGIYFDGLNLVQLENIAGVTHVKLFRKIRYNKALGFYAIKLFGPTQGFTTQGIALLTQANASGSQDYYLAPLDIASGLVDVGGRYRLADSSNNVIPINEGLGFQAARAAGKTFIQNGYTRGQLGPINLLSRKAVVTQLANLTLMEGTAEFYGINNMFVFANDIIANGGHVRAYNADTDVQDLIGYCGMTNNGFAITVITLDVSPDGSKIGMLCNNGTYIESSNWRQGLTSPNVISTGFQVYGNSRVFHDKNGKIIDSTGKVILNENRQVPANQGLGGFVADGTSAIYFGSEFSSVEIATQISDTLIFVSGIAESEYRSAVFDTVTNQTSVISQLEGVQVYVAKKTGNRFLVNGLEISSNTKIGRLFVPSNFSDYIDLSDALKFDQIESL